jgi:hypothetical protein
LTKQQEKQLKANHSNPYTSSFKKANEWSKEDFHKINQELIEKRKEKKHLRLVVDNTRGEKTQRISTSNQEFLKKLKSAA